MKKKNEENLPGQGCGDKVTVEKETTKDVVMEETVKEETAEEHPEGSDDDFPEDDEGDCVEIHAPGKEFLEFLSKLLHMMKSIVDLQKRLVEFEKDPTFDMLMDLCMVHLQEMKDSDKEKKSSDGDSDDDEKGDCDEDDDTITEAFISLKVKKLKD